MRYFFEVSYIGTKYAGFQIQRNANTIQGEIERVLRIFFKKPIPLTGSSRTDAGVHALQNYFHGDFEQPIQPGTVYNLNAMLPSDIVLKRIALVSQNAHCRFDAVSREYHYLIYDFKNPFMVERGYFYPFKIEIELLEKAAAIIALNSNFFSFSKSNSQVNNHICNIYKSEWLQEADHLLYKVKANRFLRGMVRALVATMLKVGRNKISVDQFTAIFKAQSLSCVDFAAPPQALFLAEVSYLQDIFMEP